MVTTAPGSTSLTSATSPLKIQGWTRIRGSRPRLSRRTGGFTRQAYRPRGGLDQHGPRLPRRPGAATLRQLSLRVEVERVVVARELFAALDVACREVGLAVGHIRVVRVIHVPRVVSAEHDRPPALVHLLVAVLTQESPHGRRKGRQIRDRSEERRVGKECRSRLSQDHEKKSM